MSVLFFLGAEYLENRVHFYTVDSSFSVFLPQTTNVEVSQSQTRPTLVVGIIGAVSHATNHTINAIVDREAFPVRERAANVPVECLSHLVFLSNMWQPYSRALISERDCSR